MGPGFYDIDCKPERMTRTVSVALAFEKLYEVRICVEDTGHFLS